MKNERYNKKETKYMNLQGFEMCESYAKEFYGLRFQSMVSNGLLVRV